MAPVPQRVLCCPTCTEDLRIHVALRHEETAALTVECSCSAMELDDFYTQVTDEEMDWGALEEVSTEVEDTSDHQDRMFQ